ncbi:MAG: MgtC/SapB family protein [Bacteroidaceae bacterium]
MNEILEFSLRLLVALLLGGIIGLEREYRSKDAGFRTHFLVSLGSALFCLVSQYGFGPDLKDASRVAAQVVSGIGFLGAGTIIFQRNVIRGLTTAAGLWVTAAIGLACGTGMYMAALIATTMVLLGLEVLNAFIPQIGTTTVTLSFSSSSKESILKAVDNIKQECLELYAYELKDNRTAQGEHFRATLVIRIRRGDRHEHFVDCLSSFDQVSISCTE